MHIDQLNSAISDFYREVLTILLKTEVPFLMGGAFALHQYTGIFRNTKDIDIFCQPEHYLKIVSTFSHAGFETRMVDSRWLAKVCRGELLLDIIFDSFNGICLIDEDWFINATKATLFENEVWFLPPEELIWSKMYIQSRERYDGADINHLILCQGNKLDWKRLYQRMTRHWPLLLSTLMNFQFVYPSERDKVPKWLIDDLLERTSGQYELPPSIIKVCRGPLIDQEQYTTDIVEWGYKVITLKSI